MANKIDSVPCAGGRRITRLVSTDRDIAIPDSVDGSPVVSLGPSFLSGSPAADSRTVHVPASVTSIDKDAFGGLIGIRRIEYGGTMEMFSSFGIDAEYDVELATGDGHEFSFIAGYPIGFPAFDTAMQSMTFRMTQETAMARLRDPVLLTPEAEDRYRSYLSSRIMPKAEQAVSTGDARGLSGLVSTGMFSDDDIRRLMDRSVRSGKTAVTSMLMSVLYGRRHS